MRKCELDEKDLKACSENDWDCATYGYMKDSEITEKEMEQYIHHAITGD